MNYKYIKTQDLLNKNLLTYQEILNIKKRLNGYAKSKENKDLNDYDWKDEYKITQEHTDKGLEYLFRVAFKPSKLARQKRVFNKKGLMDGATRINCPLGYRELTILLQFHHFTFTGFYDASTSSYGLEQGFHNYLPIWKCYDKDGDSFEYYISGGEMNIIG